VGCTSRTAGGEDLAQGSVRAHYEHHNDWWIGPGCFEKVTGYAYNTGNTTVDPVVLNFNLIEAGSGKVRDSRSVYLGSLGAGQSRAFESDLDGECMPDYRVDGRILP
jgi:hypothetical protein